MVWPVPYDLTALRRVIFRYTQTIWTERQSMFSFLQNPIPVSVFCPCNRPFDTAWRHAIEQGIPEDSFQRIKSRYIAGVDGIIDPHTYAREKLIQALIERQTYIPLEIERLIASETTLEGINSLLKHFDQPGRKIILRATPSKE